MGQGFYITARFLNKPRAISKGFGFDIGFYFNRAEKINDTQREKKESLVTKPSLLKESLIIPEESLHFIRRSPLIFW